MVKVTTLVIRDDRFWKSQCSCTVILFAHGYMFHLPKNEKCSLQFK